MPEQDSQAFEEEEEISSEDEEYQPSQAELVASGSDGTESESDLSDFENTSRAEEEITLLKRKLKAKREAATKKRKLSTKTGGKTGGKPTKKVRIDEELNEVVPAAASTSTATSEDGGEKSFDAETLTTKKTGKKEPPVFNDKNIDLNLFSSDPMNIITRKIKIASNILVICKMLESDAKSGLAYDYAALTFQRKTKDEKAFEFHLPLSITPNIIEALQFIMKDNPKFFQNKH